MDIKPLSTDYAVSPQISAEHISAIKEAGYSVVICNRPDHEVSPEFQAAAIKAAVEQAGLIFIENAVTSGALTYENLELQEKALSEAQGPVLAYCASGNRSGIVWSMVQVRTGALSIDEVLNATSRVGYDHGSLRQQYELLAPS